MPTRLIVTAVLCLVCLISAREAGAQTTTALFFDSQPGDWIGQGLRRTWLSGELTFSMQSSPLGATIHADNFASAGSTWWDVSFAAPNGARLTPGTYEDATNFYVRSAVRAGIRIEGSGRGCQPTGRFTVYEAVYDSGGLLTNFAADFEQHCDDGVPAL